MAKNSLLRRVLDLTTTVNLYHNHISAWDLTMQAPSGQNVTMSRGAQNSFAWDARMMANVRLPWGLSLQVTGRYNSERKEATGSRAAGWSVDAGLRKAFGNWSISLNARDIFDSRKWKSTIYGNGYSQYSESWHGGRTFRITVKYSFGNMKSKRPRDMEGEPIEDGSGYGNMEGMGE